MSRWMFHTHLWLGVMTTALVVVIGVTGLLLNHKRALGLMPDAEHGSGGQLEEALPLAEIVDAARDGVPSLAEPGVDRMDVRPDDGLVKVRFEDRHATEVTVDFYSGEILTVGPRNDVFLERLHSGEVFGDGWVLLSDIAAVALVVLLVSGYWLWLYPRSRL